MNFWLLVSVLLVLAVVLIARTVLRQRSSTNQADNIHAQRIQRNVAIYQQRLEELQQDLADQYITDEEFQSLENELSRRLLQDVEKLENAPAQTRQRRKWLWLLLPAPLLALLVYQAVGAYPDWLISQQLQSLAQSQTEEEYQQRLQTVHAAIVERLKQRPDQIDYRILLARYAMGQQDYREAALHYGVLAELLPDDADVLGYYAQAEFLSNGRKITPTVAHYMDKALALNPFQPTVLGMQGIYAFEQGDYPAAIDAWQKLVQTLPPQSQQAMIIRQGIAQAKQQLGVTDEKDTTPAAAAGLIVNVELDASLHDLDSRLTVFVYAKAVNGPPAPLAVQKLTLADLPAQITLNDNMAMMPGMSLSRFDDVIVGARISRSGSPMPQAGDWQAEAELTHWQEAGEQHLLIKDVLP